MVEGPVEAPAAMLTNAAPTSVAVMAAVAVKVKPSTVTDLPAAKDGRVTARVEDVLVPLPADKTAVSAVAAGTVTETAVNAFATVPDAMVAVPELAVTALAA